MSIVLNKKLNPAVEDLVLAKFNEANPNLQPVTALSTGLSIAVRDLVQLEDKMTLKAYLVKGEKLSLDGEDWYFQLDGEEIELDGKKAKLLINCELPYNMDYDIARILSECGLQTVYEVHEKAEVVEKLKQIGFPEYTFTVTADKITFNKVHADVYPFILNPSMQGRDTKGPINSLYFTQYLAGDKQTGGAHEFAIRIRANAIDLSRLNTDIPSITEQEVLVDAQEAAHQ